MEGAHGSNVPAAAPLYLQETWSEDEMEKMGMRAAHLLFAVGRNGETNERIDSKLMCCLYHYKTHEKHTCD